VKKVFSKDIKFIIFLLITIFILIQANYLISIDFTTQIPSKISKLKGWNGIKIQKIKTVPNDEKKIKADCRILFDENFGFKNKNQIFILIRIVNQRHYIENDICKPHIVEDVLEHLKYLAITKQDENAAWALVFPEQHQGFDLEEALFETYDSEYLIQVIDKYKNLKQLINQKTKYSGITVSICFGIKFSEDKNIQLSTIINKLKKNSLIEFANEVETECKKVWLK